MSRAAVFYSLGPHFITALKQARDRADEVVAIVPAAFEMPEDAAGTIDTVIRTDHDHYGLRHPVKLAHLVRHMRRERFDAFVVMFDSPKLRLLASVSGATSRWYCAPHGHMTPLNGSVLRVTASETWRRLKGWARYASLWLVVRVLWIRPTASPDHKGSPRR